MLYYNTKSGGSFGRDPYWLTSGLEKGTSESQQGFTISVVMHSKESTGSTLLESEHLYLDTSSLRFDDGLGHTMNITIEPVCSQILSKSSVAHHIGVIADAGPGIAIILVDGTVCDSSWNWITDGMDKIPKTESLKIGTDVDRVDIYANALRTSQVICLYRSLLFT